MSQAFEVTLSVPPTTPLPPLVPAQFPPLKAKLLNNRIPNITPQAKAKGKTQIVNLNLLVCTLCGAARTLRLNKSAGVWFWGCTKFNSNKCFYTAAVLESEIQTNTHKHPTLKLPPAPASTSAPAFLSATLPPAPTSTSGPSQQSCTSSTVIAQVQTGSLHLAQLTHKVNKKTRPVVDHGNGGNCFLCCFTYY